MDRESLLAFLRRTRFSPAGRDRARADAETIAEYLERRYGAQVYGIGSVFCSSSRFHEKSDIDLVVAGLPPDEFFQAAAHAASLTRFPLDLVPMESATPLLRERVVQEGVEP